MNWLYNLVCILITLLFSTSEIYASASSNSAEDTYTIEHKLGTTLQLNPPFPIQPAELINHLLDKPKLYEYPEHFFLYKHKLGSINEGSFEEMEICLTVSSQAIDSKRTFLLLGNYLVSHPNQKLTPHTFAVTVPGKSIARKPDGKGIVCMNPSKKNTGFPLGHSLYLMFVETTKSSTIPKTAFIEHVAIRYALKKSKNVRARNQIRTISFQEQVSPDQPWSRNYYLRNPDNKDKYLSKLEACVDITLGPGQSMHNVSVVAHYKKKVSSHQHEKTVGIVKMKCASFKEEDIRTERTGNELTVEVRSSNTLPMHWNSFTIFWTNAH